MRMKRFMKGCAITALVFGALGCVLALVGGSVAGRTTVSEVVESVTGGKVKLNSNNWWNWKMDAWGGMFRGEFGDFYSIYDLDAVVDEGMEELVSIVENERIIDENYDIQRDDVEKYCPGSNIRNLEIEIGGCYLQTERSEDNAIYLKVEEAYKFQGYVKGDTLYVKSVNNLINIGEAEQHRITLYLPDAYYFDEVEVNVGAGYLQLDDFYADEVSLEVGAGEIVLNNIQAEELDVSVGAGAIEITDMKVTKLDAEVGMGSFYGQGALYGDADIECSMGYIEMTLDGKEGDFNYILEDAMGNINIGEDSFGGIGEERKVNNHADKNMEIECAMGNIEIYFDD